MSVLEKARSHFLERLQEMGSVEVPEWECTIYFKKAESLNVQKRIAKRLNDKGGTGEDAMVQALIERAMDAEGKKLFTPKDYTELMSSTDKNVIAKILEEISKQSESETVEEAEKN